MKNSSKRFRAVLVTMALILGVNFTLSYTGVTSSKASTTSLPSSPRPKTEKQFNNNTTTKATTTSLPSSPRP